ncbi:competence protein ComEA [Arthrobacter sp. CG_A4]|nr:competence protein ComEA [Arthrobacter sp. CG_A4]
MVPMSCRNVSHRTPGPESAATCGTARHRRSATLGAGVDAGRTGGLLELKVTGGPESAESGRWPAAARLRHRTGLRAALLLGAVALVVGGWFWWQVATGAPEVVPLSEVSAAGVQPAGPDADALTSPAGAATEATAKSIFVHVAGAVAKPGVLEMPQGSRLHEAIAAAGGSTASADPGRLNLAAVLEDGQRILVPEQSEPGADEPLPDAAGAGEPGTGSTRTGKSGAGGTGSGGGKVNLNTAGVEELGTLPRVGPVLAQRIVDWRREHGRFQTVEELDAVDGVGPKLMAALLPLVRV